MSAVAEKPIGLKLGCGCPVEIIVLARRDRKRSATLAHRSSATYSTIRCGAAQRIDIMDFPARFLTHASLHMNFQK
jgi:hypothetical protein